MRSLVLVILAVGCGDNKAAIHDAPAPDALSVPVFAQTAYIKSQRPMHDSHFGRLGVSGMGDTLVAAEDGAVTVYERDPTWRVSADLTPSPLPLELGTATAISNDGATIAVGALDDAGISEVFVFRKSGDVWSQDARVFESTLPYEVVASLALSSDGSTVVIGTADSANSVGRVHTFVRNAGTWSEIALLGGGDTDFALGGTLALAPEGGALAVTAVRQSTALVEVYLRTGNTWVLHASLPSETFSSNTFGTNIACSASCQTVAIGATQQEDMAPAGTGVTYMFEREGDTWSPTATLVATDADIGDAGGGAVALSRDGSTFVMGASKESGAGTSIDSNAKDNSAPFAGAAYVFRRSSHGWMQAMYLKASNAETVDIFGSEVGVSNDGSTIVVAAPYESGGGSGVNADQSDNSAPYAGAVYVFEGTY